MATTPRLCHNIFRHAVPSFTQITYVQYNDSNPLKFRYRSGQRRRLSTRLHRAGAGTNADAGDNILIGESSLQREMRDARRYLGTGAS
jgi:hypothetical protein